MIRFAIAFITCLIGFFFIAGREFQIGVPMLIVGLAGLVAYFFAAQKHIKKVGKVKDFTK